MSVGAAQVSKWVRASILAGVASTAVLVVHTAIPAVAMAQQAAKQRIDVATGPLDEVLLKLSDVYGVPILAARQMVSGLSAPTLSGTMNAQDALSRVLAGTGLSFTQTSNGGFVIVRKEASLAIQTDAVEETPKVAETIIVTGTKQNLTLQDTQASVSVFTADQIRSQVLIDVDDILFRTANVSTAGNGSLNDLSIRGISLGGVGNAGVGNTVNVYVDGAPNSATANQSAANLWDIDQVEILRGPQSTVQGRNALAGAVIIRTADPEYDFGIQGRVRIGNEEQRQFSGVITGPILNDQIAFRIAADYREVDFDVINLDSNDSPARFQEALTLRGKLLFEPSSIEGLRVELTANYIETDFGEFNSVFLPEPAVSVTDNIPSPIPGFLNQFDIFGDATFGANRLEDNEVQRYIIDGQYTLSDAWTLNALGSVELTDRDTFFAGALSLSDDETYQAELRANFDYEKLRGWFGAYFFRETSVNRQIINTPLGNFFIPTTTENDVVIAENEQTTRTTNYAFFGDVTYSPNDRWDFNIGLRIDFEEFEDSGVVGSSRSEDPDCLIAPESFFGAGLPCFAILPPQNVDPEPPADFNAFLPRGSITYHFDALRSASFTVARGYRAGGSFVRNIISDAGFIEGSRIEDFDPEFLTNFEFAFRSLWFDERLRLNANIFYSDWTDQQVTIFGPSGLMDDFDIENAGNSELYGIEIDVLFEVNEELAVFANLGLLDTKFNDFPFATVAPGGDPQFENLAGNSFNAAPSVTASAGFSYEHGSGAFVSSTFTYTDGQFSDVENFEIEGTDSYVLANARAGYRIDRFEISLFVNNLFNDRFITRQNTVNVNTDNGAVTAVANPLFVVNDPRLWGVELRARF